MQRFSSFVPVFLLTVASCTEGGLVPPDLGALNEPDIILSEEAGPPGAPKGTCWGKNVEPAVIETVTDQILLQPAEILADGTVLRPAAYKTETVQRIVKPRLETWFEAPCADALTPEFISSVQRALKARKFYRGSISGEMDARTRAAIRRYQKEQGLNSGILALETGRQLGLIEAILE